MARPKKNNADYFTHDAGMRNHPKIKALRRKFKHDGYSTWCMLLELLTAGDGFCCPWDEMSIEIVAADFDLEPDRFIEMVNYMLVLRLVKIEDGLIFSDNHIERFSDLIAKRNRDKQRYESEKGFEIPNITVSANGNTQKVGVSVNGNTQSKLEETKSNNIKEENNSPLPSGIIKTKKQTKKKKQPDAIQLPFTGSKFLEAWNDLIALPSWKKKNLSAIQKSLDLLSKYDEEFSIKLIESAHAGNWAGVVFDDTDEKYLKWKNKNDGNNIIKRTERGIDSKDKYLDAARRPVS